MLEGSADTAVFELYVEQILAPSLHPGQIVILDNLNTHTGDKIRQAIEAQGCQLLFLPSYSPDFSSIEEAFSKLKAFLRRAGARTPETLQEAIGQALLTVTVQDARGWLPIVATAQMRSEILMRDYSSVLWIFAGCIPSGNVSSAAYSKLCRDLLAWSQTLSGHMWPPPVAYRSSGRTMSLHNNVSAGIARRSPRVPRALAAS
jgi:transposase